MIENGVKHLCAVLLMCTLVAGCSTPTPYAPEGLRGGDSDELVGPDEWVINVVSNIYTSPERVENMLALRCADLTLEKGFKYFSIVSGPVFGEDRLVAHSPGGASASVNTIGNTTYASARSWAPSTYVSGPMPKGKIRIRLSNNRGNSGIDAAIEATRYRPYVEVK